VPATAVKAPAVEAGKLLGPMSWFFFFFFVSGFCSVLYELVWLRLSMAQFGVTTAMVSIVLSVFMAGLGIGSWASGILLRYLADRRQFPALRIYGSIELLIGVCGYAAPYGLLLGHRVLENTSLTTSFSYYFGTGLWVAAILLPGCILMGATLPVGMRAIAQMVPLESSPSFSYLYTANVAGAVAGTIVPLLLIELLGFHGTLSVAVVCNVLIATIVFARSGKGSAAIAKSVKSRVPSQSPAPASSGTRILLLLFLSGLTCMGMEVVWVRSYTPYLGTVVYAFASILMVYLLATFIGSVVYRRQSFGSLYERPAVWISLAWFSLLPLFAANPGVGLPAWIRLVIGLVPFTGLVGFITPMLVDRFSAGDPGKAGVAYAVNVVGCILGPLLAGFAMLPFISERWALVLLMAPWALVALASLPGLRNSGHAERWLVYASPVLVLALIAASKDYDQSFPERRVLRDPTATVIATGNGMSKQLLVNGYGMTILTPITKVMAHLPLSFLDRKPQDALAICFGMGTTFRALRSWGIPVTAVELVPSVPRLFDYYHADGAAIMASPLAHVIIDDGRRYLERTQNQYDLITIDPPPPIEAAGSSLLYSTEFYEVAKKRLRPGGILQQWLPASGADAEEISAITRSVHDSFPYVRAFADQFGVHFLCSDHPLPNRTPDDLLQRMPDAAITDFTEWAQPGVPPRAAALQQFGALLSREVNPERLIAMSPETPMLTDDRPINEYYVLRHWFSSHDQTAATASR